MEQTVRGLHLVFDRAEQDVLSGTKKGFYNAADLNRVGEAEVDLAALCRELGHACAVSPKTDWTVADIPTQVQMQTLSRFHAPSAGGHESPGLAKG